jgi:DNA-directed RNA polymerase subunit RPC12/RpoP
MTVPEKQEKKPIPEGFEEATGWLCEDGCELMDEDGGTLYECGECGTRFNQENSSDGSSHRCPDCHKFSSKTEEVACAECGTAATHEEECYRCDECGELVKTEDLAYHREHCELTPEPEEKPEAPAS